ncbi:MAG: hypothetical protein EBV03_05250 [Proteobacteria bacterium]|nr:hypothetical protein [Pseudomonadota bacterium]
MRFSLYIFASLFFPAGIACAAEVTFPGVAPENIIRKFSYDWNKDGTPDHAIIVTVSKTNELQQELRFYLSGAGGIQLVEAHPGNWVGSDDSVISTDFSLTPRGSLDINSGNTAWGRDRWSETLTIAYRGGQFVVAGYTYSAYDTLDLDKSFICEVNLLTGKGTLNQKNFNTTAKPIPFKDWNDSEHRPRECPNTID